MTAKTDAAAVTIAPVTAESFKEVTKAQREANDRKAKQETLKSYRDSAERYTKLANDYRTVAQHTRGLIVVLTEQGVGVDALSHVQDALRYVVSSGEDYVRSMKDATARADRIQAELDGNQVASNSDAI